jgi:hypothetical protein
VALIQKAIDILDTLDGDADLGDSSATTVKSSVVRGVMTTVNAHYLPS